VGRGGRIDWQLKGVVFGEKGVVFANKRGFLRNKKVLKSESLIVEWLDGGAEGRADGWTVRWSGGKGKGKRI